MNDLLMALIEDARNHVNSIYFNDKAIAFHVNALCDLVELQEKQKSELFELYKRAEEISEIKTNTIELLKGTVKTQEKTIQLLRNHIGI